MRKFVEVIRDYPLTFSAKTRHLVMKAAHFMDKADYTNIIEDILNQLASVEKETFHGLKVVATGLISEPVEILDIFRENDIAIVFRTNQGLSAHCLRIPARFWKKWPDESPRKRETPFFMKHPKTKGTC